MYAQIDMCSRFRWRRKDFGSFGVVCDDVELPVLGVHRGYSRRLVAEAASDFRSARAPAPLSPFPSCADFNAVGTVPLLWSQVVANAAVLADTLTERGHTLATGGTSNHLVLWDLRPHGLTGSKMEMLADRVGITVNKNTIVGDKNALSPGAIRIGTAALTSRGFKEDDFVRVADYLCTTLELAKSIQAEVIAKPVARRSTCTEMPLQQFYRPPLQISVAATFPRR